MRRLVKLYGIDPEADNRVQPREVPRGEGQAHQRRPELAEVGTSHVERQNLTMRMGMRRFTRLTNAFSRKVENLAAAVSLHFMYYNFARPHMTPRQPVPADPGDGRWRQRSCLEDRGDRRSAGRALSALRMLGLRQ